MAKEILSEATALVNGERKNAYGDPAEFFKQWAATHSHMSGVVTKPEDLCMAMVEMKLLRYKKSGYRHRDSLVDAAGYIEIMGRLAGD